MVERVLAERVEGIASKLGSRRGCERMMVADGFRTARIFFAITPAEQVRRFKDRLTNPLKHWKLSCEDCRNRSRWADHEMPIENMMQKTSHRWTLGI